MDMANIHFASEWLAALTLRDENPIKIIEDLSILCPVTNCPLP